MVKWIVTIYETLAALKTAVETIDNTVVIHILPVMVNGQQKYLLAVGGELTTIDGGTA